MSVSRLPSGLWRAQTYHEGKVYSSAKVLGIDPKTLTTERKAKDADSAARKLLKGRKPSKITVAEWTETWTTHPLWQRPKDATNIVYAQQVRPFAREYGHLALEDV